VQGKKLPKLSGKRNRGYAGSQDLHILCDFLNIKFGSEVDHMTLIYMAIVFIKNELK